MKTRSIIAGTCMFLASLGSPKAENAAKVVTEPLIKICKNAAGEYYLPKEILKAMEQPKVDTLILSDIEKQPVETQKEIDKVVDKCLAPKIGANPKHKTIILDYQGTIKTAYQLDNAGQIETRTNFYNGGSATTAFKNNQPTNYTIYEVPGRADPIISTVDDEGEKRLFNANTGKGLGCNYFGVVAEPNRGVSLKCDCDK